MWKIALAGTTALAIAGTSLVYAQQPPGRADFAPHWRPSAADIAAFADARIAALHAGLTLTPAQEKDWPAVESALHDLAKQRTDMFAARRAGADRPQDPIDRLKTRAKALSERGAALEKLADAAGPLYQSLDDAQKHRLVVLARLIRPHFGNWRARHDWRHRGPGGPDGPGGPGMGGWHGRGMNGGPPPQ
jgi:zinc resistance-associated protein